MSNLEATENMNQVKGDLAGPMLELLQYNITVGNDLGSLSVESTEEGRTRIFLAYLLQWLVSHVRVIVLSKTGNAIAAVNGSAKTNEKHRNFFLRSGLKIMHGERVGIQVHHHNTNQIKTRKEPASMEPTVQEALADSGSTGSPTVDNSDLPSKSEKGVYGKRNELPGKTALATMEKAAAIIDPSPYGSGTTGYIKDVVSASPIADNHRPTTRLRARMSSLVIPEPCTDIVSETEAMPAQPPGRPAWSGKATARA